MIIPINQLSLQRYPSNHDKSLRAWSAADELLLAHIETLDLKQSDKKALTVLIINDQFGAITVSLNNLAPIYWTDSYLSNKAIELNLQANFQQKIISQIYPVKYQTNFLSTLNLNDDCKVSENQRLSQRVLKYDLIIIRIPKHNSLLEFQLQQIQSFLTPNTIVVAAGMTKEIHKSNIKLFNDIIGSTSTSLAKKKARLIFSTPDAAQKENLLETNQAANNPHNNYAEYFLADHQLYACGLAGVFSREKLDIGTRVLLDYLPQVKPNEKVIDLGCGNGILGAVVAKNQPECRVLLSDESQLAVASASLTFERNQLTNGEFIQTDVLRNVELKQFDHILCNPPFHQQNMQTLTIANNMFKQSAHCLKASGELRVVANRHLQYLPMLKRYFKQVKLISKDPKFSVWLASEPLQ